MPRRRYRRRSRALKTVKYSNETTNVTGDFTLAAGGQVGCPLISAIDTQGTRKAKNFTMRFVYSGQTPLLFALVYVPAQQKAAQLTLGTPQQPASLFEPAQNVIMSGYIAPAANEVQTFRTRLARNLNSGDHIDILLKSAVVGAAINNQVIGIILNYAITF